MTRIVSLTAATCLVLALLSSSSSSSLVDASPIPSSYLQQRDQDPTAIHSKIVIKPMKRRYVDDTVVQARQQQQQQQQQPEEVRVEISTPPPTVISPKEEEAETHATGIMEGIKRRFQKRSATFPSNPITKNKRSLGNETGRSAAKLFSAYEAIVNSDSQMPVFLNQDRQRQRLRQLQRKRLLAASAAQAAAEAAPEAAAMALGGASTEENAPARQTGIPLEVEEAQTRAGESNVDGGDTDSVTPQLLTRAGRHSVHREADALVETFPDVKDDILLPEVDVNAPLKRRPASESSISEQDIEDYSIAGTTPQKYRINQEDYLESNYGAASNGPSPLSSSSSHGENQAPHLLYNSARYSHHTGFVPVTDSPVLSWTGIQLALASSAMVLCGLLILILLISFKMYSKKRSSSPFAFLHYITTGLLKSSSSNATDGAFLAPPAPSSKANAPMTVLGRSSARNSYTAHK